MFEVWGFTLRAYVEGADCWGACSIQRGCELGDEKVGSAA